MHYNIIMKKQGWTLVLSLSTVILLVAVLSYLAFCSAMRAETTVRYYGLQNSVAMQLYKTISGMEMSATNVFNNVEKNLASPEAVVNALEKESYLNPDVRGYFAAFEPNYFKEKGTWFEPYVHHSDSSKFEMTQVGSAHSGAIRIITTTAQTSADTILPMLNQYTTQMVIWHAYVELTSRLSG